MLFCVMLAIAVTGLFVSVVLGQILQRTRTVPIHENDFNKVSVFEDVEKLDSNSEYGGLSTPPVFVRQVVGGVKLKNSPVAPFGQSHVNIGGFDALDPGIGQLFQWHIKRCAQEGIFYDARHANPVIDYPERIFTASYDVHLPVKVSALRSLEGFSAKSRRVGIVLGSLSVLFRCICQRFKMNYLGFHMPEHLLGLSTGPLHLPYRMNSCLTHFNYLPSGRSDLLLEFNKSSKSEESSHRGYEDVTEHQYIKWLVDNVNRIWLPFRLFLVAIFLWAGCWLTYWGSRGSNRRWAWSGCGAIFCFMLGFGIIYFWSTTWDCWCLPAYH